MARGELLGILEGRRESRSKSHYFRRAPWSDTVKTDPLVLTDTFFSPRQGSSSSA